MKNVFKKFLLIFCAFLTLVGCADSNVLFKSNTLSLENKRMTFPMSLKEFEEKTGLIIDDEIKSDEIYSGGSLSCDLGDFGIVLYNTTKDFIKKPRIPHVLHVDESVEHILGRLRPAFHFPLSCFCYTFL